MKSNHFVALVLVVLSSSARHQAAASSRSAQQVQQPAIIKTPSKDGQEDNKAKAIKPETEEQIRAKKEFNKLFLPASPTSRPGKTPVSSPKTPKRKRMTFKVTPISKKKNKVDPAVKAAFKDIVNKAGEDKNTETEDNSATESDESSKTK